MKGTVVKIDPVALTQRLTEANVHPGFYKMLGLKGPMYRWVKCPLEEVKVGDIIKIVEYDEIPKGERGIPDIPEGWSSRMKDQCGKETKISSPPGDAFHPHTDAAYVEPGFSGGLRLVFRSGSLGEYIWHNTRHKIRGDPNKNLFYVRR